MTINQDDQSPVWWAECDVCPHKEELTDNPDYGPVEAGIMAQKAGWQIRYQGNGCWHLVCPACIKVAIIVETLLDHYSGCRVEANVAARDVLKRLGEES